MTKEQIRQIMMDNGFIFSGEESAKFRTGGYLAVYTNLQMDSVTDRVNDVLMLCPEFATNEGKVELLEVIHDWISDSMVHSSG